jgi:hypothetical protein
MTPSTATDVRFLAASTLSSRKVKADHIPIADVVKSSSHMGNHRATTLDGSCTTREAQIGVDPDHVMRSGRLHRKAVHWILRRPPHERIDLMDNICRDLPLRKVANIELLPVSSRPPKRYTIRERSSPECAGIRGVERWRPRERQKNCESKIASENKRGRTYSREDK